MNLPNQAPDFIQHCRGEPLCCVLHSVLHSVLFCVVFCYVQTDWLPNGVCLALIQQEEDAGMVLPRLDSIETRMLKMVRTAYIYIYIYIYAQQALLRSLLSSFASCVRSSRWCVWKCTAHVHYVLITGICHTELQIALETCPKLLPTCP